MYNTQILTPNLKGYQAAIQALRNNEVIGVPSETVYGLAGRGFEEAALAKIFAAKERPHFDPLILHIATPGGNNITLKVLEDSKVIDVAKISNSNKDKIEKLISHFWPGPITLVLPKTSRVPDLATSGFDTVAVRMPAHPVFQELLSLLGEPLAAPSANRFGRISPTSAQDVFTELQDRIPYIVDGGRCPIGVESTIIGLENDQFVIYRPGGLSTDKISKLLGTSLKQQLQSEKPVAPGMLKSHYAPTKPFLLQNSKIKDWSADIFLEIKEKLSRGNTLGILISTGSSEQAKAFFKKQNINTDQLKITVLSKSGEPEEGAHNLFKTLRDLDESSIECIYAEPWPNDIGLGFAIQDRMNRAAAK